MQTKFKRREMVKILVMPNPEYVEYSEFEENPSSIVIKVGMNARINILLPNGQYHVEILDDKGNVVAYAPFSEDDLEKI